jgi:hypothetical protein
MMRPIKALLIVLLQSVSIVFAQHHTDVRPAIEISVKDYGMEAFLFTRSSGSISLTGTCQMTADGAVVQTNLVRIAGPSTSRRIDEMLNNLSETYPHVVWSRSDDGLLHLRDGRSMGSILRTQFKKIEIDHAVSLRDALRQVMLSPEFKTAAKNDRLLLPPSLDYVLNTNEEIDHLRADPKAYRFTHTYREVTLEGLLDSIVQEFPGVWIYCECPERFSILAVPTGGHQSKR